MVTKKEKSRLVAHAEQELAIIGLTPPTREQMRQIDKVADPQEGWNMLLAHSVMSIITLFASQGHSGASAANTLQLVDQLARFKPLSPLTNNPAEWLEVAEGLWQNNRNGEAFSSDGGKTFHLLDRHTKLYKYLNKLPKKARSWVWKNHRNWVNTLFTSKEYTK